MPEFYEKYIAQRIFFIIPRFITSAPDGEGLASPQTLGWKNDKPITALQYPQLICSITPFTQNNAEMKFMSIVNQNFKEAGRDIKKKGYGPKRHKDNKELIFPYFSEV